MNLSRQFYVLVTSYPEKGPRNQGRDGEQKNAPDGNRTVIN